MYDTPLVPYLLLLLISCNQTSCSRN